MNEFINSLLAQAAGQPASISGTKQANLLAASLQKQENLGGAAVPPVNVTPEQAYAAQVGSVTGAGSQSATGVEQDLRGISPVDLYMKYGPQAQQMIAARSAAGGAVTNALTSTRDRGQVAGDVTSGIGMAIGRGLGGIAATGLGMVDKDAGAWATRGIEQMNEFGQSTQSPALQQRRNLVATENQMEQRDSTQQFNRDIAEGDSPFIASLARIGRDAVSSVGNAMDDPTVLSSGIAEGVGSMLALAPVGRAANAAKLAKATAARDAALAAGKTADEAAAIAKGVMAKVGIAMPAAIGALEAGGVYTGVVGDVSKMTHAQLMQNSPAYAELIAQGSTPEDAKTTIANRTGLFAAAITAPAAVAAGSLVSRFAGNPAALVSGGQAVGNLARETTEETLQGGSGALASNLAIRSVADKTRTMSEGVGEQMGTGALYGLGAAATMQAPSLAGAALSATGSAALAGIDATLGRIVTAREEENRKSAPNSIEKVTASANAAQQEAPVVKEALNTSLATAAPEVSTRAQNHFDSLVQALTVSPDELQDPSIAATGSLVTDAPTRLDAIDRLVRIVRATEGNPEQQIIAAHALYRLVQPMEVLASSEESNQPDLPEDAKKILDAYSSVMGRVVASPEVTDALASVIKSLSAPVVQAQLNDVNQTPESAQTVIAAAALAPQSTNPEVVGVVLRMAQDGSIRLTPDQTNSLLSAQAMMRSAIAYDKALVESGLVEKKDAVGIQVKTSNLLERNAVGRRSGFQHAKYITSLINNNDIAGAAAALQDLGMFVLSQQNKVAAVNQHFTAGKGAPRVRTMTLTEAREWKQSREYGVTPTSRESLEMVQGFNAEAQFLTTLHNQLAEAYRDQLNIDPIPLVQLDAALQGDVNDVAAEFASGTRSYPGAKIVSTTEPIERTQAAEVTPVVEPVQEADVVKSQEPAREAKPTEPNKPETTAAKKTKLELLVEAGKATLRDGIFYVKDAAETAYLAATNRANQIYVNIGKLRADENALTKYIQESQQKTAMFKLMGIDPSNLVEVLGSTRAIVAFLRDHELSLQKNEDQKSYPKTADGKPDLMNPKALAIEARATLDALSDEQLTSLGTTRTNVQNLISGNGNWIAAPDSYRVRHSAKSNPLINGGRGKTVSYEKESTNGQGKRSAFYVGADGGIVDADTIRVGYENTHVFTSNDEAVIGELSLLMQERSQIPTQDTKARKTNAAKIKAVVDRANNNSSNQNAVAEPAKAKATPAPAVAPEPSPAPAATTSPAPAPAPAAPSSEQQTNRVPEAANQATVVKPSAISTLFNNLVNAGNNFFLKAFNLPENPRSRLIGSSNPLQVVSDALRSDANARAMKGEPLKGTVSKEVRDFYKNTVGAVADYLVQRMNDALQAAGNGKGKNGKSTSMFEHLEKGDANPLGLIRGKVLNIVEATKVGGKPTTYAYNQELVESAVLAGIQWMLTASSTGPVRDESDIAALLGISEEEVTSEMVSEFNHAGTMTKWDVIPAIAQKIVKFWGLQNNNDYSQSMVDGIPQAVATEVVRALVEHGVLVQLPNAPIPGTKQQLTRFKINYDELGEAYKEYPTLLDELISYEPDEVSWFGEERPPVARNQMNNPMVENTAEQKKAIKFNQATPYYVDMPMYDLFTDIGLDGILDIFGAGSKIDESLHNKQHLATLNGSNMTLAAAFEHMTARFAELTNRASVDGVSPDRLGMHYAFNMSKAGRLQMLGKHNPQASKLVREVFLPTRTTLDLTDSDTKNLYMLSLAQALGVKVHTKPLAESVSEAQKMLDGPLADAVNLLTKYYETGSLDADYVSVLKTAFDTAGDSIVAIHAIADYARSTLPSTDRTSYETSVYLEADGVTNGPTNAMALLTTGSYTVRELTNIAKGGFFLEPGKTMNRHRVTDKVDLYKESTNKFAVRRNNLREELASHGVVSAMDRLTKLMSMFIKDITVTEKGDVILDRGVAKNPLTITVYGAGAKGIAGNVGKALMDEIYAKLSAAMQKQATNGGTFAEAMFGDMASPAKSADQLYQEFMQLMNANTTQQLLFSRDRGYYIKNSPDASNINLSKPAYFELPFANFDVLQRNLLAMFVAPLRQGIEDTLGYPLMDSSKMIQLATQLQSLALARHYKAAVEKAVREQVEADPSSSTMFLSRKQQDAILADLIKQYPFIKTAAQTFFVAKNSRGAVNASAFSRALNDTLEMAAMVFSPSDAGVSGSPLLIIGMGDGLMMQDSSNIPNAVTGTLKIFDGVNLPIDKINEGSLQANASVAKSWESNILRAVLESFDVAKGSVKQYYEELAGTDEALYKRLENSLAYFGISDIDQFVNMLSNAADSIDARIATRKRVAFSLDQMASAEQPHQNDGEDLSGLTVEEQVNRLNEIYKEELTSIQGRRKSNKEIAEAIQGNEPVVVQDRIMLTHEALLREISNLPEDLKELAKQAIRSPAMQGYTMVIAPADQINEETSGALGNSNGITLPAMKRIYVATDTAETRVHELVHAATFEAVLAHYQGQSTQDVADAVGRLEKLMEQFQNLDMKEMTVDQVTAYNMAKNAMTQAESAGGAIGLASKLNEFMAWATTNQELISLTKTKPASSLVQLTKAVFKAIKGMFWKNVSDDMFSNIRFNTAILMTVQPTGQQLAMDVALPHNTAYGNDQRLQEVEGTFNNLVSQYLKAPGKRIAPTAAVKQALTNFGGDLTMAVQAVFPMSMQEKHVFQTIAAALATEAAIDPGVLAKVQQMYSHVTKSMSVESFMNNPELGDPVDRYYAQEKYDLLVGKSTMLMDAQGRSSLLPAFLALATTNEEFREVLRKIAMPKAEKNAGTSVDDYLRNFGNHMMESLSNRMAGTSNSDNVLSAIDALNHYLYELNQQKETIVDTLSKSTGGYIDQANDYLVEQIGKLSDKVVAKTAKVKKNSNNRLVRLAADIANIFAGMATEKNGALVAEGVMSSLNRVSGFKPLRDLVGDFVGRTASNANVYDMIKTVRSAVQAMRQQFRENVPDIIAKKFKKTPTAEQWTALHKTMGKSDLAVLAKRGFAEVTKLLTDSAYLNQETKALEDAVEAATGSDWALTQRKAKQLANYMVTGNPGVNLLRNAEAVSKLLGEGKSMKPTATTVQQIDELITLYALQNMDNSVFSSLVQDEETDGLEFVFSYLTGQRKDEVAKASSNEITKYNAYKGYIPSVPSGGVSLIVADDAEHAGLLAKSYKRVGEYVGSSNTKTNKGYYFVSVPAKAGFSQGIMQNVNITAGGVSATTGISQGITAGVITDPAYVKKLQTTFLKDTATVENLMPVYRGDGSISAFERSVDPIQLERLQSNIELHKMLGVWRGRQVEEQTAGVFNQQLVGRLHDMYRKDLAKGNQAEYINIFDSKDTVIQDAVKLLPAEVVDQMALLSGNENVFMVRRDMLDDAFGYRSASIGDPWTGNSRWSPRTQEIVKKIAMGLAGNLAYKIAMNSERFLQGYVADAKTLIVIKSVVVPVSNMVSVIYQLIGRGVPIRNVFQNAPKKAQEIDSYVKGMLRQVAAEAELRAAVGKPLQAMKLEAEIQSIKDAHRRLSIWPLIEAGEFTAISDVGLTHEDIDLTEGKVNQYIEKLVGKLPETVRNAGRYALITKDTALYQGLHKAVQYGDFLGKALLYDDLVKRKNMPKTDALARITEEFVNYDRLPGRFRGYMESIGMMWFYNFKIRTTKVALSMIRNNPVHALIASLVPAPDVFGPVGLPTDGNAFAKLVDGSLDNSMGVGQGLRAPMLNPWLNVVN